MACLSCVSAAEHVKIPLGTTPYPVRQWASTSGTIQFGTVLQPWQLSSGYSDGLKSLSQVLSLYRPTFFSLLRRRSHGRRRVSRSPAAPFAQCARGGDGWRGGGSAFSGEARHLWGEVQGAFLELLGCSGRDHRGVEPGCTEVRRASCPCSCLADWGTA